MESLYPCDHPHTVLEAPDGQPVTELAGDQGTDSAQLFMCV